MKKQPILTITIPAYNVELYLEDTIMSLVKSKFSNIIEVLIVNDGSSDKTLEISNKLAKKYTCIKVVDKPNGGHGSAINAGIKHATGKYFRLLDGDDWFDTQEFDRYLEKLQKEDADIVLTDYVECFCKSNLNRPVSYYSNLPEYQILDLNELVFPDWGSTLPTSTVKTSLLKSANFKIDEHCFYVDQEYNMICYILAKTAVYYPCMIYQYRLEREGQSMERASLIRNVSSHETVCARLLSEYSAHKNTMPKVKQDYFHTRVIIPMCHMQYEIAINYCKSRKNFLSFDKILRKYPEFYNNPGIVGSVRKFHRKTKGIFVHCNI